MPIEPVILTPPEISCLRRSCSLAREALHSVARPLVRAGVTTEAIDDAVRAFVLASGAYPSPLNFDGFPKSVSTSVNDVAGHGIPDDRPLEPGDVVNVDVTVYLDGFHGDTSATFVVPGGDPEAAEWAARLVSAARECLYAGVAACGPDEPFLRIGHAISKLSKRRHVRVVPQLCGHGIGRHFHAVPDIYHTLNYSPGAMKPGMAFTIEPCVSEGLPKIRQLEDGWTWVTVDGSRTAQFEHTVLVTPYGVDVLTM